MKEASLKFGDGGTLPFTACKKGFRPFLKGTRMFACPFHDKMRRKRLEKEGWEYRKGEVNLGIFWTEEEQDPRKNDKSEMPTKNSVEDEVSCSRKKTKTKQST